MRGPQAQYHVSEDIVPYSQKRAEGIGFAPWPIETLVLAQCMACAGKSIEEIAAELELNALDVAAHLEPHESWTDDPLLAAQIANLPRRARRPERANVGYANVKAR